MGRRVVVVGQATVDLCHRDIIDAILLQHTHGNIATGKSIGNRHLRITFEFALQRTLYGEAHQRNNYEQDINHDFLFYFLLVTCRKYIGNSASIVLIQEEL